MKLPHPPNSLIVFLSKLKVIWSQWDIQTMVLTSFTIQLILIFLAPFRKQTSNWAVIASVWLAYLLADLVAVQAIGLIAKPCGPTLTSADAAELYAFWAQFLLLHLGGPDTITALALEDSELWLRTGLHLGVQVYGSLGILVKSVGQSSQLWIPTMLIFVAGIVKYMERVSSLFNGRLIKYSNQDLLSWDVLSRFEPYGMRSYERDKEEMSEVEMVQCACFFFHYFKGLYAGRDPNTSLREHIDPYLAKRSPEEILKLVDIQLNLAYEVFYTKMVVICSPLWKALRFIVTLLQAGCLVIWLFFIDKSDARFGPHYNIRITHTLLAGAVLVDMLSFLRIQLWSDWTIALAGVPSFIRKSLYNRLLAKRARTWGRYWRKEEAPLSEWLRRAFFRRWSESIPQLSVLALSLDPPRSRYVQKAVELLRVEEFLDRRRFVTRRWFSNQLRLFLFEDLSLKIQTKGCVENICKVKGGWACLSLYQTHSMALPHVRVILGVREDYDVVMTRWHIITELCYREEAGNDSEEEQNYREICKTLSDYLMYLLSHHPEMMPTIPYVTKGRLEDMERILRNKAKEYIYMKSVMYRPDREKERREMGCKMIREEYTTEDASSALPFFPINQIMEELKELEEKKIGKWEFMAKVWGELLYYAAFHCKTSLHAAMLKQGGELISFVWLLLTQMGFGVYGPAKSHSVVNKEEQVVNDPADLNKKEQVGKDPADGGELLYLLKY